jgi:hypothetical protein
MRYFLLVITLTSILAAGKLPSPCYFLELTSIGFPTSEKQSAAWNIRDLIFFNNKLYLGHGDAVINTGPTDVIFYDPESKEFITEFTVDDEAIYLFQIIDDKLMIPGVDATEDWSFGNFYILTDTGWVKHRTLPLGLHINYLASYNRKLFASTGTYGKIGDDIEFYMGSVFCSTDTGKTWKLSYTTPSDDQSVYRVNQLIVYEGKLYAFPFAYAGLKIEEIPEKYHKGLSEKPYSEGYYLMLNNDIFGTNDVLVYDSKKWHMEDIVPENKLCYIYRPFIFKNKLIIPALFGDYIDYLNKNRELVSQAEKFLFCFDGKQTEKIKFNYDKLIDVLIKTDILYLLIKRDDLHFIAKTDNLKNWEYFLIPPAIRKPISLEHNQDRFYIGSASGNIFESVSSEQIEELEVVVDFVPRKVFGAAELPRDSKWYWVAIADWENPGRLAKISADIKFNNVIKLTTQNISKMYIFLPFFYLDPGKEVMFIINDEVVYEGDIANASEFICTKIEKNEEIIWDIEKGDRIFEEYEHTKKLLGTTEIELKREGEDPLVGCWKADVIRWIAGADCAIITRSGTRKDLTSKEIYLEDIYDVHYRNRICVFNVSGKKLEEMMSFNLQQPLNNRCQISGFTINYHQTDSQIEILNCTLEPEKYYRVATEDYLAERAERFLNKSIDYKETEKDVYEAIIEWFNLHKTIKDIQTKIVKVSQQNND